MILKKNIILNKIKRIPFSKTKEIQISSIEGIRGPTTYQVNLILNNKELMLISSERLNLIQDAAKFLSKETGIPFNKNMYEA